MRTGRTTSRRGVAMLLVLVSLAVATVITSAYLAARDNSAVIGKNVAASTETRWAALAGLEMSTCVLETRCDWRTSHDNGRLLTDYCIDGNTSVDIDLLDLDTGLPPNEDTTTVRVTSTATLGGVQQTASAVAFVGDIEAGPVDIDLSEFVVFASRNITMSHNSTITRWPMAPASANGDRLAVGTQAVTAGSVTLNDQSASIDTTVWVPEGASAGLIANNSGPEMMQSEIPGIVPMPAPPDPGVAAPNELSPAEDIEINGSQHAVLGDTRFGEAVIKNGGMFAIADDVTVVFEGPLHISEESSLGVGPGSHATIVAFDDVTVQDGAVFIGGPDSTLTMYVHGKLSVDDGYIGELPYSGLPLDSSGTAPWVDPSRIRIYSFDAGDPVCGLEWGIQNNSVVKGDIYAPGVDTVKVWQDSALHGRVATQQLDLADNAAIFYDHGLDEQRGYTEVDGPLYDAEGALMAEFLNGLTTLDCAALITLFELTGIKIDSAMCEAGEWEEELIGPWMPSVVTARNIPVTYDIVSFGNDSGAWESEYGIELDPEGGVTLPDKFALTGSLHGGGQQGQQPGGENPLGQ